MNFRLLAPAMLWALLGLAVPLVLHLLGRGERRRVPFVNVRWLVPRPALRGLRFAPSDPALLAVRLALLALLVLALAQPSCSGRQRGESSLPAQQLDLATETDLWGALRAADRDLPPGAAIEVVGAAREGALLGSRPVFDREVSWDFGAAPARSAPAPAPPRSSLSRPLRYAIESSPAGRSSASTWRGWIVGLGAVIGFAAEEVALEARPDLLVRIADPAELESLASGLTQGATWILVPARGDGGPTGAPARLEPPLAPFAFELRVEPGSIGRGRVVARDARGRALVAVAEAVDGATWRFAFPVTLEATSLPRSPAWIELGWAVLRPLAERRLGLPVATPTDSARLPVALAKPARPPEAKPSKAPPSARSVPWHGAWWAMAGLAIAERWLASRRVDG